MDLKLSLRKADNRARDLAPVLHIKRDICGGLPVKRLENLSLAASVFYMQVAEILSDKWERPVKLFDFAIGQTPKIWVLTHSLRNNDPNRYSHARHYY